MREPLYVGVRWRAEQLPSVLATQLHCSLRLSELWGLELSPCSSEEQSLKLLPTLYWIAFGGQVRK
jgi:hypothetical protein